MLAQLAQFGANKYFIHVNKLTDFNFVINIKNNTTLILLQKLLSNYSFQSQRRTMRGFSRL
ncbi:MAG: hypothetical protein EBY53_07620 [Rhodobacteraceae bacterium]|nr:hypothetical protein [Paracoccaceae bacterium]